jgi:hypothetical protein
MATSEIEKLERRYAENPQGLTFAPLAEIHRKNGDVVRALELLRAGLELHPNYIPASIVLGRCHWDAGDLPAAESAFAHVLRLDDENVIALKSLADINERLERFGEAQRWLNRLLSVDRSNEDARQQLARLETAKQQKPVADPAPAEQAPEPIALEITEAAPATAPEAAKPPPGEPELPAPEKETQPEPVLDLTAELGEPASLGIADPAPIPTATEAPKAPDLEFLETSDTPSQTDEVEPTSEEPVAGLISSEFVPPNQSTYRLHPELTQDFIGAPPPPPTSPPPAEDVEVETMDDVELQSSGADEFRMPNAAEDLLGFAALAAQSMVKPAVQPPEPPPVATPVLAAPPSSPPAPEPASIPTASAQPASVQPGRRSYSAQDTKG